MSNTTYTTNLIEAAPAASMPCRHSIVVDDRRFGSSFTLAERCAR